MERQSRLDGRPVQPIVAIVEDDPSARAALLGLVEALGFRGHGFTEAAELLRFPQLDRLSCVIADMRLRGGMSGLQLHVHLRVTGRHLPCILVTAYPDQATARAALHAGALAYLAKPVPPEALLDCLQHALSEEPG